MKIKKVTTIKDLTKSKANSLSNAYQNEEYVTEIIPTYLDKRVSVFCSDSDRYELHVYELIKRTKRWYTVIERM